jgi:uncharacterized protein (DUF1501 family)
VSDRILVLVSLRGGVDALNTVVPHGDPDYYRLRPSLAVPGPKSRGPAVLDLDGFFGFHPALAPLLPLWERKELAIVHAVGWPGVSHSHFEAWEEIECGALGEDRPQSGWLARALAAEGGARSPLSAVAFADTMPRLLTGALGATVLKSLSEYRLAAAGERSGRLERVLKGLYRKTALPVGQPGVSTLEALEAIERMGRASEGGGTDESLFGRQLGMIARLIRADVGVRAVSAELGGWDFHFAEGSVSGLMPRLLGELARGLVRFRSELGDDWRRVVVVAISEFGRRAAENGSAGTDHGQAGTILVAGGGVRGGRVCGEWPGLSPERLAPPGDLAITTDFRDVLLDVLPAGLGAVEHERIFPRYRKKRDLHIVEAAS